MLREKEAVEVVTIGLHTKNRWKEKPASQPSQFVQEDTDNQIEQGFLQLDDTGSQHDLHLKVIGGHHETLELEGHNIHILQNKG